MLPMCIPRLPRPGAGARGAPAVPAKRVNASNSVTESKPVLAAERDPAKARRPGAVAAGSDCVAVRIRCKISAHRWTAAVSSRPTNRAGCPFYDGTRPADGNRTDLKWAALASQWHPTKNTSLTPSGVTTGSNKREWFIRPQVHKHVWETSIRARALDGDGCKWCAPVARSTIDVSLACEFAAVFPLGMDPTTQERLEPGHNRPHGHYVLIKPLSSPCRYGLGTQSLCPQTGSFHRTVFTMRRTRPASPFSARLTCSGSSPSR